MGKKKASRSAGRVARLAGASVLLVEDDFILLSELEMVVSDAGADIVGACRTAKESLEIIATSKVDAAILDFRLTNGSSGEIANALVKARIPFLFYTGQSANDPAFAKWPGSSILTKPSSAATIVSALTKILRVEQ